MNDKKLLAINLNEFNLEFLKYGSKKYNLKNINKFLKLSNIETFSVDKTQDKNLDPWVQSISINSGQRSSKHKIFNLGEKIPYNINQIWDHLSSKNLHCAIWGPMNTNFKNNKLIKVFMPDPWNMQNFVKPKELKDFYSIAREYAQNYTQVSKKIKIKKLYKSFFYLLKNGIIFQILKNFFFLINIYFKKGLTNYFLFFLYDIISLLIFMKLVKSSQINFSLIFLNSLAHFQHNNWDDKEKERDYFLFTDLIFKIIFQLSENYNSLMIYNGFSQKKIKKEFMIRPKDPKKFLKSFNIKFNKFHSNMTNGVLLSYKSKNSLKSEFKKIRSINILGFQVYETKIINSLQIFCRIQIRSKKKFDQYLSANSLNKYLFYENKKKLLTKNINSNIQDFVKNISFIKTTSKHTPNGHLFYKNLKLKKNKIENVKIFHLFKNYFK